jgi:hypothetical protein
LDRHWCERNFDKIFPLESPANCRCALDGLAFAQASKSLYDLLLHNGIVVWALRNEPPESRAREHILQLMALAYLWGVESLESPRFADMFDTTRLDDLETVSRYFWTVSKEALSAHEKGKISQFWAKCLIVTQNLPSAPKRLLASLSQLACYLESIGTEEERLLSAVVPHLDEDFHAWEFLKQLHRLVSVSPVEVARVFGKMIETYKPTFDYDNAIQTILKTLAHLSDTRADALRYAEQLVSRFPGLVQLYQELTSH